MENDEVLKNLQEVKEAARKAYIDADKSLCGTPLWKAKEAAWQAYCKAETADFNLRHNLSLTE